MDNCSRQQFGQVDDQNSECFTNHHQLGLPKILDDFNKNNNLNNSVDSNSWVKNLKSTFMANETGLTSACSEAKLANFHHNVNLQKNVPQFDLAGMNNPMHNMGHDFQIVIRLASACSQISIAIKFRIYKITY